MISKKIVVAACSIIGLATFFIISTQHRSVTTINSFTEVNFDHYDKDTLVLIDVDETLIQPVDAVLINQHNPKQKQFRKKLKEKYNLVDQKAADYRARLVLEQAKRPLIEPIIISIVKELQSRNVSVIAFTGMNTGKKDTLLMEQWRYEHLSSLGFHGSWEERIQYFEPIHGKKPVFYKGVLCTGLFDKGPVFKTFLETFNVAPKKVVFFDDTLDYVLSVEKICKEKGIAFEGYVYKGAKTAAWDDELFEAQADWLINHNEWLDDAAVRAMMQAAE